MVDGFMFKSIEFGGKTRQIMIFFERNKNDDHYLSLLRRIMILKNFCYHGIWLLFENWMHYSLHLMLLQRRRIDVAM